MAKRPWKQEILMSRHGQGGKGLLAENKHFETAILEDQEKGGQGQHITVTAKCFRSEYTSQQKRKEHGYAGRVGGGQPLAYQVPFHGKAGCDIASLAR